MKFTSHEIPEKKTSWLIKEIEKNGFLKSDFYRADEKHDFSEKEFIGLLRTVQHFQGSENL